MVMPKRASFLFLYFSKTFFTEIYFQFHNLQFYTPAAEQEGDRDLYVNKKKLFARWPLAGACRPPTGRQGACRPAGGRQAPPPRKIAAVDH